MNMQSIWMPFAVAVLSISFANAQGRYAPGEGREESQGGNIHELNKGIDVDDNQRAGNLHTVNGSITIGNHSEVKVAKTVNGSVTLGADSRAEVLETVNGKIEIGPRSTVTGDVSSVNGRLNVSDDATIQGDLKNVNSKLILEKRAHIVGQLTTVNGDITLEDNARVDGGILVKKPNSRWGDSSDSTNRIPVITIGREAVVSGQLVFERPVKLRVHSTAKIGSVKGAEVERF
jgi:hypothetical protein